MFRSVMGGLDEAGPDDGFEGGGFDDGCVRFGCDVDVGDVGGPDALATIRGEDVDIEEQAANITRSRIAIDVLIPTLPVQSSSLVSRSTDGHP
ncbi:MAG: hypothetical protein WAO00_10865 [Chthoniobacterales bacterium]